MTTPVPNHERKRLEVLWEYEVLDTVPEAVFDDLTELAADICEVPIALISLVDEDRQWFKSKVGVSMQQTPREHAFCAHAIMGRNLFVVRDATRHKHFASNPLVISSPKIRFYAGMPLVSPDNHALGTLCVIDHVPRVLSRQQKRMLELLSRQVMTQLVLRRQLIELKQALRERQRHEKLLNKNLRTAQAACRANHHWMQQMEREIQAAAAAIHQATDQLQGGSLTARQHRQFDQLKNVAGNLIHWTREILRYSRIEREPTE
jgi:GAF domain-containing protein